MSRSPLIRALLLSTLSLSTNASIGHAQSPSRSTTQPSQKVLDEARKHFQNAEAAKARGEYQTAVVEYLAAYKVFDEPAFLYDTAEVYRLAGDENNALIYYTKYLELAPRGQGAPAARVAADQIRRSIASKEEAAKRKADAEARRKADDEAKRKADSETRRKVDDAKRKADAGAERTADAEAKHKANDVKRAADKKVASSDDTVEPSVAVTGTRTDDLTGGGRGMRVAGLVTGGVGVLGLGLGVVFGLKARSLSNAASSWTTYDRKRDDQGEAYQRNMFVFTGIGAAALIGGGILYYLGHRAEPSTASGALSFAPSIGPSEIAVTAAGYF